MIDSPPLQPLTEPPYSYFGRPLSTFFTLERLFLLLRIHLDELETWIDPKLRCVGGTFCIPSS